MVPEMFYKYFIVLKRMYPQINFIIAGDFAQLLPVKDRVDCDYKNSVALFELRGGKRIQLSRCRRSDDTLFKMLLPNNIKNLKRTDFHCNLTEKHTCCTNEKRKQINQEMMTKMDSVSNLFMVWNANMMDDFKNVQEFYYNYGFNKYDNIIPGLLRLIGRPTKIFC
jgi:hypothetical protein